MARDNANAAEQLKASQEQIARLVAKASEQNLRPEDISDTGDIGASTAADCSQSKPAPTPQSPQARARPQAPTQLLKNPLATEGA